MNLVSSGTSRAALADGKPVVLPETFFVDVDGLIDGLAPPREPDEPPVPNELPKPPALQVTAEVYRDALAAFGVVVRNHEEDRPLPPGEEAFEEAGDTHFQFLVPERAFEDTDFVRQLVRPKPADEESDLGLISERLAGCLLMVDFPNPVFSERRTSLLGHVPPGPLPAGEWATFSERLGNAIAAAGDGPDAPTAEREFAELWAAGEEGWRPMAAERLRSYYEALTARLTSPDGFRDVFRLAEARRNRVHDMPISEAPMLFAQTAIPGGEIVGLAMRPDGSVEQPAPDA